MAEGGEGEFKFWMKYENEIRNRSLPQASATMDGAPGTTSHHWGEKKQNAPFELGVNCMAPCLKKSFSGHKVQCPAFLLMSTAVPGTEQRVGQGNRQHSLRETFDNLKITFYFRVKFPIIFPISWQAH